MEQHRLDQIRSLLSTTADHWTKLAAALPAEAMTAAPQPGEWSALGCLQHMIDTERVFGTRLQALLAGRDLPAFDPDAEGTGLSAERGPADVVAEFARLREESLAALGAITVEDGDRRARHSELGEVTLGELLHEWAAHDLNHTIQAERALMQPFIAGCGPWQVYFSDHAVGGDV